MPRRISRAEAIHLVETMRRQAPGCLPCALAGGRVPAARSLARSAHARAFLTRFPREWGHVLVLVERHVVSFDAITPEEWLDVAALARRAAVAVERVLRPARCYVASLGTTHDDVITSYPHLHLHVLPVLGADDRPSQVFTWEHGVLEADEDEWDALARELIAALPDEGR